MRSDPAPSSRAAFTLVELLAVIGIIALLIGILLPVLNSVQRRARDVKCQSNMRQAAAALLTYAAENRGKFPPNCNKIWDSRLGGRTWNYWCEPDRIGKYLPVSLVFWGGGIKSAVLICPEDDDAARSYSMNFWASCVTDQYDLSTGFPNHPRIGRGWDTSTKGGDRLILLAETLSYWPAEWLHVLQAPLSWAPDPTICNFPSMPPDAFPLYKPGRMFVGDMNIYTFGSPTPQRYSPRPTPIDWARHRRRGDGGTEKVEARGRANFAFADGHVASYRPEDLADRATGKSKFVALWSPGDYAWQKYARQ